MEEQLELDIASAPHGGVTAMSPARVASLVGERLTLEAFSQLCGKVGGHPFVKVVVDRIHPEKSVIHFINHACYQFHSDYIAETLLHIPAKELERSIDEFNRSVYLNPERRFYLGILALHRKGERFFTLETVEIDNMDGVMVRFFHGFVRQHLDMELPLLFKPANHLQEAMVAGISPSELPRVFSRELYASSSFVALNPGSAKGRLRVFKSDEEYQQAAASVEWYDIIVMKRVPDTIPRLSGIINAEHTTPLSHTNVLASGWQIPNAVQIGVFEELEKEAFDGQWVNYVVDSNASHIHLEKTIHPIEVAQRPAWSIQTIKLEEPETINTPIAELDTLRISDRHRYGTKAANLGELRYVLENGSERLLGFYKIRRPPRSNLLPHLAKFLGLRESADGSALAKAAWNFLRSSVRIPRGIALPFSTQQEFLESSPRIQQAIGKLKMALELNAREVDSLCLSLQSMIRVTRLPDRLREYIDSRIADQLGGVSSFVVRSSSNAEDLDGFSAAGIYESINHVTTAENIFQSIKEVWASLVSPRSVRLRHDVGISLDDCYMGVIIQEEIKAEIGGVIVTTNPMNRAGDFRNVYINVLPHSVDSVVHGVEPPFQYLYNTVEGGGMTLSIGNSSRDLDDTKKGALQKLAYIGRLLQSHFSPDYTFSAPMDIEWLFNDEGIFVLQLRPYSK